MSTDSTSPILVLDVGGTSFSAAVVRHAELLAPVVRGDSRQDADAETLVGVFASAIAETRAGHDVAAAVVAVPGPFDYDAGVSRMEHKFAALFGIDLGARLTAATRLPIIFVNDAQAAAVGGWIELGRPDEPVATVTLGTGVGSGLVVNGEPSGHDELWCAPYRGGIVEDLVSSRALRGEYEWRTGRSITVAEIGALADDGDAEAAEAFRAYGTHLGRATASYFADARPATVVVAGGVTGAWAHIEPAATAAYEAAGGTGAIARSRLAEPALIGGAELGRRSFDSSGGHR